MYQLIITPGFYVSVVILSTVIFYYFYFFFITSGLPEKYSKSINHQTQKAMMIFLLKKSSGFLILGLIPGIIYYFLVNPDFGIFGLSLNHIRPNLLIIVSLMAIITVILFINQKINRQNNSLQINVSEWNIFLFLINAAGWIIYLIGYEFLFRGILLFECYASFGFWPAIAINIAIYSAIHLVNGKDQALGALIFGGIACYFTLSRGTILIPVIMHITLSLGSDYFSIRYNKSLRFVKQSGFKLPVR
jgi:membrane protease YdiL (CAAX protease family)